MVTRSARPRGKKSGSGAVSRPQAWCVALLAFALLLAGQVIYGKGFLPTAMLTTVELPSFKSTSFPVFSAGDTFEAKVILRATAARMYGGRLSNASLSTPGILDSTDTTVPGSSI